MIGKAVINLLDRDEEYIFTFPSGYGRSILTVPWFEMGGQITINCPKTGFSADIEFLTKVRIFFILKYFLIFCLLKSHFIAAKRIKYKEIFMVLIKNL
jgi:hypothetical protein